MSYALACIAVLLATYLLQSTMITVFYHRALAHRAVELTPWARRIVASTGIWVTGLDPKAWVCMHRRHHRFSDTEMDPHSPEHKGFFRLIFAQLSSYERTLGGLARGEEEYCSEVADLDFEINRLNRLRLWMLPYVVHAGVALAIALPTGWWALGAAYWVGMMSHPVFGWVVNSFGHAVGSRNFDTPDNSRNNLPAAWLILGEGLQNNHHAYPASAKFSTRAVELDLGWLFIRGFEKLGVLRIERSLLIPSARQPAPLLSLDADIAVFAQRYDIKLEVLAGPRRATSSRALKLSSTFTSRSDARRDRSRTASARVSLKAPAARRL